MTVTPGQRTYTVPGLGGGVMTNDAAIASGLAFLNAELEKRDPRLLEPLQSVTWPRDIVARTGGGWVEFSSQYFVDYATTGGQDGGIIGGESNDIPIMQANLTKDVWKVFTFSNILKVPFVDQSKLQGIGRSLDDILDKGIRLNYNKSIDNVVYVGVPSLGVTGLVNDPNVTASAAPNGASGQSTWQSKTPQEILDDVNSIIQATWQASEYDLTGMANHILIPPAQYSYLVGRTVSQAGNISILQFLLENNLGRNQGIDLVIAPSRWCTGAGVGGKDRMVAYVNDEDRVNFDLTVPLSRVMTQSQVTEMAYLTAYAAQFSQVKILYRQCIQYMDGI
ncbi:DUF2184 domain-containing protein [Alicyclobacillus macrosporangiidus]|uniref:DUF2184 domain-containing protein n=1 Tax=Alicyclobacillus macrosporangiidus TaxID=392015 RepID=A0A1I7IDH5_9BACL|nr:DUF2184 domain-containing protein [Alicyclobacillus macrosporangiidus]SFU71013.1 hypothetical protein SAMN05421543_106155 [Alicyclobacillus macrosporangiidus]